MISKSLQNVFGKQPAAKKLLIQNQFRCAGGGVKIPPMPASNMDFDIVFVGGMNAAAIVKFIQTQGNTKLKMAFVSAAGPKYIMPQSYLGKSHGHITTIESGSVSAQILPWSRSDLNAKVVEYKPAENKVLLSNGREYTYKALVLSPGLDHRQDLIEGLEAVDQLPEEDNVFIHQIDTKQRVSKNYYHGWSHKAGDMVCYSPQAPYKGEGTDFWALYYESFLRQDQLQGVASRSARIQYWTPNKEIYKFPYANEVALEECRKRGVDVMLGWEMVKVEKTATGEKIATFKNVDSGEMLEHPFNHANINPASQTHQELVDSGIAGACGMVDVNRYTLQHDRFPNIFALGDCIAGETTRTQHAAYAQVPIVKHNVAQYLNGETLNAIYDGYTYMPFYLGHSQMSNFQHLWDFEPAPYNHWVPAHGLFATAYASWAMGANSKMGEKLSAMDKNSGPPHFHYSASYDPIDKNEYLIRKGVDTEELASIHAPQGKLIEA